MNLRNKYYSYPVIVEGGDYYTNSSFETDVQMELIGYNIKFIFETNLVNDELKYLLETGEIIIVHHIECPQTCYRQIIKTKDYNAEKIIRDMDLNGIVQICSFLVSTKDLNHYENKDFSAMYKGFKFDIDKGCIMAVGNQINFTINKMKDDLANNSSIFSIIPNHDANAFSMDIDLNDNKIAVVLPKKTFAIYKNIGSTLEMQQTMHQMIIIPALMFVFSELKSSKDQLYVYEKQRWYRNLLKACEKINQPINEDTIDQINILQLPQLLLDNPIIGGMKNFVDIGEEYED